MTDTVLFVHCVRCASPWEQSEVMRSWSLCSLCGFEFCSQTWCAGIWQVNWKLDENRYIIWSPCDGCRLVTLELIDANHGTVKTVPLPWLPFNTTREELELYETFL